MTDLQKLKEFIRTWANSENNPHFAILLEGTWGAGKSHLVKKIFLDRNITDRPAIYLSAFGIPDIASFESQLFYASASNSAKIAHYGADLIGSALKATFKIDLTGDSNPDATVDGKFGGLSKFIEGAYNKLDGSVLIIDDIERCRIPQVDLLGVINRLVEHGNTRVVLVANSAKIEDQGFRAFKEKVVGQSFLVTGDSKSALQTFTAEINPASVRRELQKRSDRILELHAASGYGNLRALRQFCWSFSNLLAKLDPKYLSNGRLIDNLTTQGFIFFTEFKLDLPGHSEKLVLDNLFDSMDINRKNSRKVHDYGYHGNINKEKQKTTKAEVLEKYGFRLGIDTSISVGLWKSFLEAGTIDRFLLNDEVSRSREVLGDSSLPSWRRLWHFQSWDFKDDSRVQFERDLADLKENLSLGRYIQLEEFVGVARVVFMLIENSIYPDTPSSMVEFLKEYVDKYIVPNLNFDAFNNFDGISFKDFKGSYFAKEDSSSFREVFEYLLGSLRNWHTHWIGADAGAELAEMLKQRPSRFFGNLTVINAETEQRFLDIPILHTIDVELFVDSWLSLSIDQERALPADLARRYRDNDTLIVAEGPWWRNVQIELVKRKQVETFHPRSVQIGCRIDAINDYILDRWDYRRLRELIQTRQTCSPTDVTWTILPKITKLSSCTV